MYVPNLDGIGSWTSKSYKVKNRITYQKDFNLVIYTSRYFYTNKYYFFSWQMYCLCVSVDIYLLSNIGPDHSTPNYP